MKRFWTSRTDAMGVAVMSSAVTGGNTAKMASLYQDFRPFMPLRQNQMQHGARDGRQAQSVRQRRQNLPIPNFGMYSTASRVREKAPFPHS
jgi:hypothetical protein